jgi:flagellar biosynthesis/type III secretory pathway chaperone
MFNADSHAASAESIAEALAHELETLTQVVETLDIEHEALMGSDPERLEQAVAAKQRAIAAHAQARNARESLGLKEELQRQIESHPGFFNGLKDQALGYIEALRENGAKSKNANQRNGMLIAGLRERTRSALGLLRPDSANVTLYGQGGSAEDTLGSRLLGSA